MSILLINSDVANIGSWIKILRDNNCDFVLSNDIQNNLNSIKKIIFPGVGNFGKVIDNIKKKKLDKIISTIKKQNIKYWNFVGMQILFDYSEESNSMLSFNKRKSKNWILEIFITPMDGII